MAIPVILMLDRRRKMKNNNYRICLVINFKGSRSYINLGRSVTEDFWDQEAGKVLKGAKVSSTVQAVNDFIQGKLMDARRLIEQLDLTGELAQLSHSELRNRISNKSKRASFSKYLATLVSEFSQNGHAGQAKIYGSLKSFLIRYADGDKDYKFEDINFRLLKRIETNFIPRVSGSRNGLSLYFRTIRAVWNRAIKEGVVKKELYPFSSYQIKSTKTHKTAISAEDMRKIKNLVLPIETHAWHGKNMFLFSFYTRGMNFADIANLKGKNIDGGRITYVRLKTKDVISIMVDPDIDAILCHYLPGKGPDDYIFPIIKTPDKAVEQTRAYHSVVNHALKRWAKKLEISSTLSFNTARHTWATIARDREIPIGIISEGLGHRDLQTTQIYLDDLGNDRIDAATKLVKF